VNEQQAALSLTESELNLILDKEKEAMDQFHNANASIQEFATTISNRKKDIKQHPGQIQDNRKKLESCSKKLKCIVEEEEETVKSIRYAKVLLF